MIREAKKRWRRGDVIVNLSGRGDKDLHTVMTARQAARGKR